MDFSSNGQDAINYKSMSRINLDTSSSMRFNKLIWKDHWDFCLPMSSQADYGITHQLSLKQTRDLHLAESEMSLSPFSTPNSHHLSGSNNQSHSQESGRQEPRATGAIGNGSSGTDQTASHCMDGKNRYWGKPPTHIALRLTDYGHHHVQWIFNHHELQQNKHK